MGILIFRNGKITGNLGTAGVYDGEKQMGDLSNWPVFSSDSNNFLDGTYKTLTERSTTLYHTYPAVRSAVNKQVDYAIGPGLVFRSQPDYSTLGMKKENSVAWGKDFQKIVNYYFKEFNFYEKQSVLFRTALVVGDSLLMFERGPEGLTDLIEISGDQLNSDCTTENFTMGIKHDDFLRRIGVMKIDGTEINFENTAGYHNLVQFYTKELARQLRGYPLAYSIINMARNDDTHTDAITQRAVMESIMMAVFKGNGTNLRAQVKNLADKNKTLKENTGSGGFLQNIWSTISATKMGAGNILQVRPDEDITFTDMKTPSNNFGTFKDWMLYYVGMATGTPPEMIKGQYTSSFTSHKGALNDFVKCYIKKRRTFERSVMRVVVKEIAMDALLKGYLKAPGFFDGGPMIQAAYLNGMFLGPVPGHINPLVEVKADAEKVKNAFDLRSDMAEKNGHDWDHFIEEWAEEQDKFTGTPQNFADRIAQEESKNG